MMPKNLSLGLRWQIYPKGVLFFFASPKNLNNFILTVKKRNRGNVTNSCAEKIATLPDGVVTTSKRDRKGWWKTFSHRYGMYKWFCWVVFKSRITTRPACYYRTLQRALHHYTVDCIRVERVHLCLATESQLRSPSFKDHVNCLNFHRIYIFLINSPV